MTTFYWYKNDSVSYFSPFISIKILQKSTCIANFVVFVVVFFSLVNSPKISLVPSLRVGYNPYTKGKLVFHHLQARNIHLFPVSNINSLYQNIHQYNEYSLQILSVWWRWWMFWIWLSTRSDILGVHKCMCIRGNTMLLSLIGLRTHFSE